MSGWLSTLDRIHRDATRRVPDAPSWDHVATRARALNSGALVLRSLDTVDALDAALDVTHQADLYEMVAAGLGQHYRNAYATAADLRGLDLAKLESLHNGAQGGWFELAVGGALDDGSLDLSDLTPDGYDHWAYPKGSARAIDLQFFDADGLAVQGIQIKATHSLSYIRDTLERYPDVPIVATTEVAHRAADAGLGDMVVDSGISLDEFPGMGGMAFGLDDLTPYAEDFNVDLDGLDAALFGADVLITTLTGGEVKAALLPATVRAGRRIGREFVLNSVAEIAVQATGSAVTGDVIGVSYATYRIGRAGRLVLDFRDQEVGFTTRQLQRYHEVLGQLGTVDRRAEEPPAHHTG